MSNGCRSCDALFGMFFLGRRSAWAAEQATRGQLALLPLARAWVPPSFVGQAKADGEASLGWSTDDWRYDDAKWLFHRRHQAEWSRPKVLVVAQRESVEVLPTWGSGADLLGFQTIKKRELVDLVAGYYLDERRRLFRPHPAFDRRTGSFSSQAHSPTVFDVSLRPPEDFVEAWLVATSNDEHVMLDGAIVSAALSALQSLEDYAPLARVSPAALGLDPAELDETSSGGGKTVRTTAALFGIWQAQRPPVASDTGWPPATMTEPMFEVHVVLPGMGWPLTGQRTYALDGQALNNFLPIMNELFLGQVARELSGLGYQVEFELRPGRRGFDWHLTGSSPSFRSFLTECTDPTRALREALEPQRRQHEPGELFTALRESHERRREVTRHLRRSQTWQKFFQACRDAGVSPGSITRQPPPPPPLPLAEREAKLAARLMNLRSFAKAVAAGDSVRVLHWVIRLSPDLFFSYEELKTLTSQYLTKGSG